MQIIIGDNAFTIDEKTTFRIYEIKEIASYTDYTVGAEEKTEKVETYTGAIYTMVMSSDYFRVKLKDFWTMNDAYTFFREIKGAYDDDENFVVEN